MNYAIGVLLTVVGLGMIGFWTIHIIKGGMPQGIKTLENGGYIAFHISAELLTGILCIVSGIALFPTTSWSIPVGLLASGMLLYTSLNSIAWSEVRKKPALSVMFIVPGIIALVSITYLLNAA